MESLKCTPYWNVWGDCYSLHRKFYGVNEDDNVTWEAVLQESKKIRDNYKNSEFLKFAESLVLLVVSELEHKSKLQKGAGEDATKE